MTNHLSDYFIKTASKKLTLFFFVFTSFQSKAQDTNAVVKLHTASIHVRVMDTAFFIPQLKCSRRIWIYLPEGYNKSFKKYPVVYMQDGQNIFDEFTAFAGEWGVDECLDSLISKRKPACIVVGIDNVSQKLNEKGPYSNEAFEISEVDKYLDFLVKTLKPNIDKYYRTLPSKENTIIAGSGMGGLMAYYAMLMKPEVFGKGGIFSPSFWVAPEILPLTDSLGRKQTGKFFFYIGGQEDSTGITAYNTVTEKLGINSNTLIYSVIDPENKNNEQAWRKWFAEFYNWIMADGFNNVIKLKSP